MHRSQAARLARQIEADGLGSDVRALRVNPDAPGEYGWGVDVDGATITSSAQLSAFRQGQFEERGYRTNVRLSDADAEALRRLATERGTSINTEIAAAVRAYITVGQEHGNG